MHKKGTALRQSLTRTCADTHMHFLLSHLKVSCRYHGISHYRLHLVYPKYILLSNHSGIIIPPKFNVDHIDDLR